MSELKARPNLPVLRDRVPSRPSDLKLGPLSDLVSLARQYHSEFPASRNGHLETYAEVSRRQKEHAAQVRNDLQHWDPHNDVNLNGTDPYRTVFVGRLPYATDELTLQKVFSKYGEIVRVRVVRQRVSQEGSKQKYNQKQEQKQKQIGDAKSRGYAFIVFKEQDAARICTRDIGVHRGIEIDGRRCIVDIERGRTVKFFKPRRLGGGLGGRGYTQQHNTYGRAPQQHDVRETPQRDSHSYMSRSRTHTRDPSTRETRDTRDPLDTRDPREPQNRYTPRTTYRSRTARQEIEY
ncbi:Uncharacterized protein RNJ44_00645 [Nakaseomyces bracarensis]|uniref:RRM domain-containing protein n=1 Tax=Nakaseomyces bracarensis TaxID=273131 RepID=A0ABR4NRN7_9SACH